MLTVHPIDSFPEGDARTEWARLVAADPDATFFHAPRYLHVWLEHLGGRVEPRVKLFARAGTVVGVVPEELERIGTPTGPVRELRFLGGTDVTDYLGPVAAPADRDEVAAAWIGSLADDRDWDEVAAGGLAEDTGWPDLLSHHARQAGFDVVVETDDVCPRVDIGEGADAWLAALPAKHRHELRRKGRKLARELGGVVFDTAPAAEAHAAAEEFLELASQAAGAKGRFFIDERMRAFFLALVDEFAADGSLRIDRLLVGERTAAATVSLIWDGAFGLYNSSFDQGLGTYAPGMVLVGELIRAAAEARSPVFDLLRGDEPYKYRFGAHERTLQRLTFTRS